MGTITLDLTHRIVVYRCLLVAWYLVIGMAHADEHIKLFSNLRTHIRSAEVNGVFHNGVRLLLKIKRKQLICWLNLLSSVEFVGRGHACMAFIKNVCVQYIRT